jgi:hypothetical protein
VPYLIIRPPVPTHPASLRKWESTRSGLAPDTTSKTKHRKKPNSMTEATGTTEDEFYDEAQDEFPIKEDFEDRLVAVWVTGNHGTRKSEAPPYKEYGWVETITAVLDDGQDGTKGSGNRSDGKPFLIGPAPAVAEAIQWSAEGMYARLRPRIGKVDPETGERIFKPLTGRINRRKNAKRGFNDSWSIGSPTDSDKEILRANRDLLMKITAQVAKDAETSADAEAFES